LHVCIPYVLPCCPLPLPALLLLLFSSCLSLHLQPAEIYVDDEAKLTLHGLVQHYVMLHEEEKNRKLTDLLDALDFNQVRFMWCNRSSGSFKVPN
jgi:hypothetical protein